MSKGSNPRPIFVPPDEFAANFERIFGKQSDKPAEQPKKDENK